MCGEEWRMEKNGDIILETSHLIFVMERKKNALNVSKMLEINIKLKVVF